MGAADAEVIRLKIGSMEAGNYAVVQVAEALSGTLVDVLLAGLIRDSREKKTA